jgi:hypothetical protein
MANRTTSILEKELQGSVDRDEFERYRRDPDEIKSIRTRRSAHSTKNRTTV